MLGFSKLHMYGETMTQQRTLRPYQAQGVEKLIELTEKRNAAILADEPGLGKTIQVAEYINRTRPAEAELSGKGRSLHAENL